MSPAWAEWAAGDDGLTSQGIHPILLPCWKHCPQEGIVAPAKRPVVEGITSLIEDLIRLKPRLKTLLPSDLDELKQRLGKLHPDGGPSRAEDYDLFYRVGVVLSRAQGPLTMGDLSALLEVPLSTATRMVDWLVDSGYVQRLSDPEDRRIVRVSLSRTGQDLYLTINHFLQQRVEEILRDFTADERRSLASLLRKLVDVLEEPKS